MYYNEMNQPTARRIPVRGVNHSSKEKEIPIEPALANADVTRPQSAADTDWQAVAQRLQADMANFRKRQTRRAEEAIVAERERLLQVPYPFMMWFMIGFIKQPANSRLLFRKTLWLFRAHGSLQEEKVRSGGRPFIARLLSNTETPKRIR